MAKTKAWDSKWPLKWRGYLIGMRHKTFRVLAPREFLSNRDISVKLSVAESNQVLPRFRCTSL